MANRKYMESRFGYDFRRVRVHADEWAGVAARAINARAFTVGADIVLDALHFGSQGAETRRLLAHELAHVVQQGQGAHQLQRWADCKPARLSLEDCPPRQEGEAQNARHGPMVFLSLRDPINGHEGVLIANFDIGSAAIKSNLHGTLYWKQFLEKIVADRSGWSLLGFTDCQGAESINQKLREDRAAAVFNIFPPKARSQIVSREAAASHECVAGNNDSSERTLNRSVALILESSSMDMEPEQVVASLPHREPSTESCSDDQRKRLAVAFPIGKRMIENALAIIDSMHKGSEQETLFMKYFGKDAFSHRLHIKRGYTDTLREWQKGGPSYPYVCVKQGKGECTYEPLAWGYVESFGLPGWPWGPKGDIHICEAAFEFNDERLAAVLVHETSHRLDWATTDVYCDMLTNQGCSLGTEKAEDNADSYAQFAREAFERWG